MKLLRSKYHIPKSPFSKYKAKKSACLKYPLHKLHDSAGEARYCNHLHYMRPGDNHDRILDIKVQVPFILNVNGIKICTHWVDFTVERESGKVEVHEYKGYEMRDFKIKHKLFKALNPHIEYIIAKRK